MYVKIYFQANHSQDLKKKNRQRSESFNEASIREQTDEEKKLSNLLAQYFYSLEL